MFKKIGKYKEWIIRAWFAGMVCFIVGDMMNGTYLFIGIGIGLISATLIDPIVNTVRLGNKIGAPDTFKELILIVLKNEVIAIFICLIIMQVHLLLSFLIGPFKEPFSFALIYQSLYSVMILIYNKLIFKH